ncbi:hypothetical protein A6C57_00400 [Fibrella sp. ES10-3-2-2]|nr:hypothetical protein A6C57_00400 [Fibrella sp. ES10-3-2-2]
MRKLLICLLLAIAHLSWSQVTILPVSTSAVQVDAYSKATTDSKINTRSATVYATTYANAQSQCAALPAGVAALVKVEADESDGNAGTGPNGANPTTYYIYFPIVGLQQQVLYPK